MKLHRSRQLALSPALRTWSGIGLAAALLALSACAPLRTAPVNPRPGWIGHITSIEGPRAFVDLGNTSAARPATVGETLLPGDRFFTGDGTRMKIEFAGGGYVELDENTDPSLFQDVRCFLINLFSSGRIFVDQANGCIESGGIRIAQQSKVVYEVMRGGFLQVTVVEGQARSVQPPSAPAPASYRLDVQPRSVLAGGPYRVSEEEIRNTISWTLFYRDQQRPLYRPPADRWPLPGIILFPPRRDPGGFDRPNLPPAPPPVIERDPKGRIR